MLDKFQKIEDRYKELEQQLSDPVIIADQPQYQKLAKEYSDTTPAMGALRSYHEAIQQIKELEHILADKPDREFEELAKAELSDLQARKQELENQLTDFLYPKKQEKDRDLMIEIRAGTGGQEASIFAADLSRMYTKYGESKKWKVEVLSSHESEAGGFKEVILGIRGIGASRALKWESGAHRVQRVPATEAAGRIHTSAATVAVMFEPEEVELNIDPKDLKVDVFRASGPGGQSVNTTDSAVRITHGPSGVVVVCQDERSQLKNRMKAMRVLRTRILDKMQQDNIDKATKERKAKIGTGDRSEKIRTYNYSDHRVTDHRIGFSTYRLHNVMDGEMDELVEALRAAEEAAERQEKEAAK